MKWSHLCDVVAPLMRRWTWLVPTLYIIFLMLPIYWLVEHVVQDHQ